MLLPIHDADLIIKLIPQRDPIVLVDTLYAHRQDFVLSGLQIQADNLFVLDGLLQECGLLEHMAQSVALHTGYDYFVRELAAPTGYIGSMQAVELFDLPKVGDFMRTEVRIIQEFMGVTLVDIVSKVNERIIAKAQMKTVIAPN